MSELRLTQAVQWHSSSLLCIGPTNPASLWGDTHMDWRAGYTAVQEDLESHDAESADFSQRSAEECKGQRNSTQCMLQTMHHMACWKCVMWKCSSVVCLCVWCGVVWWHGGASAVVRYVQWRWSSGVKICAVKWRSVQWMWNENKCSKSEVVVKWWRAGERF